MKKVLQPRDMVYCSIGQFPHTVNSEIFVEFYFCEFSISKALAHS